MLLKPKLDSILEIFSCVCMPPSETDLPQSDFDSTLLCVVFWLPSLFQMQAGLRVASCLVQWWISNCTSARAGSDCSCNQSVQQRRYRGVCHRATIPWMQAENLLQSQHIPGRTIHPTSPSSSDPPGGGGRTHSPDHMWPLCLLQSLSANSIPLSGVHRPGSLRPVGSFTHPRSMWHIEPFFPFPNPPLSLSVSSLLRTDKASVIKPWFFTVHFPSVSLLIVFRASTWPGTISNAA